MTRIKVDLPEPLAPRTPKISPRSTRNETSSTASTCLGAGFERHGIDSRICELKLLETACRASAGRAAWIEAAITFTEQHLHRMNSRRRIGQMNDGRNASAAPSEPTEVENVVGVLGG